MASAFCKLIESAGRVADVRLIRVRLDLSHAVVGLGQLPLQRRVAGAVAGQAVEILHALADHQLPRRRRSRQLGDGVVELEDEAARQGPYVVEALLGAAPLGVGIVARGIGGAGLPQRRGQRPRQSDERDRRGRDRDDVAPYEGAGAIAPGVGPGADRPALAIARQILGQLEGALIAPLGLFAQRLHDDGVEIATQQPAQPVGSVGRRRRRQRRIGDRAGHGEARTHGISAADDTDDLVQVAGRQ